VLGEKRAEPVDYPAFLTETLIAGAQSLRTSEGWPERDGGGGRGKGGAVKGAGKRAEGNTGRAYSFGGEL